MRPEWTIILDRLFCVERWKLVILAALFLVPALKIACLPFVLKGRFAAYLNKSFGVWEHLISGIRDLIATPFLVASVIWCAWRAAQTHALGNFAIASGAILLVALGQAGRVLKTRARIRLLDFTKDFPFIHPQEFFDYLFSAAGILNCSFPARPLISIDPADVDFRKGLRGALGIPAFIRGIWSTVWIMKLATLAGRARGDEFMHDAANAFSVIWGARLAQIARARVSVEGRENLPPPGGPQIFLYTHSSFLDFALAPLALAARPGAQTKSNFLPKFLIAKDHFVDNPIFNRVLGIGRAARALGMIFVDRKASGKNVEARRVTFESAAALIAGDTDLAIFPQGTRALGFTGPKGERRDSGYYTVGGRDRIRTDGGHLKKGAAHIAVTLADQMAKKGSDIPITLIPVAITGAATACPRGAVKIFTNIHIRLRVEESITVVPSSVSADSNEKYYNSVKQLHARIDVSLKNALRIHAELERRFFEDMRGLLDPMKIDEVAIAMKPWRGDDYLLHAILDAIYSCRPELWRNYLGELTHLILNFAARAEFLALKSRIADKVRI